MIKSNEIVGKSTGHVAQKKRTRLMAEMVTSIDELDTRVTSLEDTMRINGTQEYKIHEKGKASVMKALGGKDTPAYKKLGRKVFSAIWSEFKHYFDIPRYNELPAKRFKDGLKFVETWQPKQELLMNIEELNKGVSND